MTSLRARPAYVCRNLAFYISSTSTIYSLLFLQTFQVTKLTCVTSRGSHKDEKEMSGPQVFARKILQGRTNAFISVM